MIAKMKYQSIQLQMDNCFSYYLGLSTYLGLGVDLDVLANPSGGAELARRVPLLVKVSISPSLVTMVFIREANQI